MAKPDHSAQKSKITFRCGPCRYSFSAIPGRVDPAPEQEHHPWEYFARCPECDEEAEQAAWERAAFKAWTRATGPRTPEGKAASAANLDGHPTPEEALRTRFNGMKHGLSAKTATYFPAKPGGYAFCTACDVDWGWCAQQVACQKRTELFMLHHAAFDQRDPKVLSSIYADIQAAVLAVIQQILQTIIADGVKLEAPQYYTDKDGKLIVAEYLDGNGEVRVIKDIQAHPLFKPLGDLLSKNGLSLADMGMTAKVVEEEEQGFGRLAVQEGATQALSEFAQVQAKALENLGALMQRAENRRNSDPILIEYKQQNGGQA